MDLQLCVGECTPQGVHGISVYVSCRSRGAASNTRIVHVPRPRSFRQNVGNAELIGSDWNKLDCDPLTNSSAYLIVIDKVSQIVACSHVRGPARKYRATLPNFSSLGLLPGKGAGLWGAS